MCWKSWQRSSLSTSSMALGMEDEFDGNAGFVKMQSIMQAFRGGIKEFGGKKVVKPLDYAPGLDG